MIYPLIKNPGIQRDSEASNRHVSNGLHTATRCVNWLKSQGFTVLNVTIGRRNPRIEIVASRLCNALEGAVCMTERGAQGQKQCWVANRFDCEVRWTESGVAA